MIDDLRRARFEMAARFAVAFAIVSIPLSLLIGAGALVLFSARGLTATLGTFGAGAGLYDPGSTGIVTRTALNSPGAAMGSDVTGLFRRTGDYLKKDGSTGTPSSGNPESILSPDKDTGTMASAKTEATAVAGSATATILSYTGSGYVASLFIAIKGNQNSRENSTLNIFYDGEAKPSVSIPLVRAFGAVSMSAQGKTWASMFVGMNGDATDTSYWMRLPIPFATSIRIDIVNGSGSNMTLWSHAIYCRGVANNWYRTRKLFIKDYYLAAGTANTVYTALNATGLKPGRLVGMWMLMDNYVGNVVPRLAPLEGNIKIYLDGGSSPTIESPGTEDWFLMGFYQAGIMPATDVVTGNYNGGGLIGTTLESGSAGGNTVSFYRFHLFDPIGFNTALRVDWQCGDAAESNFTGSPRVWMTFWYYTE